MQKIAHSGLFASTLLRIAGPWMTIPPGSVYWTGRSGAARAGQINITPVCQRDCREDNAPAKTIIPSTQILKQRAFWKLTTMGLVAFG